MTTIMKLVLAAAVMLSTAAVVQADGGHGGFGGGHHWIRALIELNLTPAQQHDIAVILKAQRDESKAAREQARAAHQRVRELMTAAEFNEESLRAALQDAAKFHEDRAVRAAKTMRQVLPILTQEQRDTLKRLRDESKQRRQ
jgi:Spy/CpxP family protein refolding chaperone